MIFYPPGSIIRGIQDNTIHGTAIVYYNGDAGTECKPFGDTYERIAPGAFDDVMQRGVDVIATYDHKQGQILGRTPSTLRLIPKAWGIDFELQLPDTTAGRDTRYLIERGDLRGCSFTGRPDAKHSTFTHDNGKRVVTHRKFSEFQEIALVVLPYYTAAQIKRGQDLHSEIEEQWLKLKETEEMIAAAERLYKTA